MGSVAAAFIAAFLLTALPGKWAIARLRGLGAKQNISQDAPAAHGAKQGTPTMGGLMFLFPFTLIILGLLAANGMGKTEAALKEASLLPLFLMTLAFAGIGFTDDYLSAKRGKNLGLTAPQKFSMQCLVAIGFVFWMARATTPITTQIQIVPTGILMLPLELGWFYYPLAVLFIVGLSNATNITDGLDGLAGGITILISITLTALVWLSHPELGLFTIVLAGSLAGFLWWNAHPARVFMGDTGSLPLGAALAGVALVSKQEVGVIVASLVCWIELISVIIQVSVFKWRRARKGIEYARANRVFRRTPLHHHFEEMDVPETTIVTRFWIAGVLLGALALLWGRLG